MVSIIAPKKNSFFLSFYQCLNDKQRWVLVVRSTSGSKIEKEDDGIRCQGVLRDTYLQVDRCTNRSLILI